MSNSFNQPTDCSSEIHKACIIVVNLGIKNKIQNQAIKLYSMVANNSCKRDYSITESSRAVQLFFFFSKKSWDFCLVSNASAALTVKRCVQSLGPASTMPLVLSRHKANEESGLCLPDSDKFSCMSETEKQMTK